MRRQFFLVNVRHVLGRIGFQLFQKDAVFGDLALGLTIRRAGNANADRQRSAVARQANDAHVMAEIFAAELCADTERLRELVDFSFHFEITEGVPGFRTLGGQAVQIARRGELDRLQVHLGGSAADDDRQMVRRAGGCAEAQDLVLRKSIMRSWVRSDGVP